MARKHIDIDSGKALMAEKVMTVDEVATYLRVKVPIVYEWVGQGKIAAVKVGSL